MKTEIAMDPNVSIGMVALIGITTVFFALTVLVGVLIGGRRILDLLDPENAVTPPKKKASLSPAVSTATASLAAAKEDLALIATAAYAFHMGRRVTVRAPQTQTRWAAVGRQTQVMRFERRK